MLFYKSGFFKSTDELLLNGNSSDQGEIHIRDNVIWEGEKLPFDDPNLCTLTAIDKMFLLLLFNRPGGI